MGGASPRELAAAVTVEGATVEDVTMVTTAETTGVELTEPVAVTPAPAKEEMVAGPAEGREPEMAAARVALAAVLTCGARRESSARLLSCDYRAQQ